MTTTAAPLLSINQVHEIKDSARIYAEGNYPKLKVKRSDTLTVEIEAVA